MKIHVAPSPHDIRCTLSKGVHVICNVSRMRMASVTFLPYVGAVCYHGLCPGCLTVNLTKHESGL